MIRSLCSHRITDPRGRSGSRIRRRHGGRGVAWGPFSGEPDDVSEGSIRTAAMIRGSHWRGFMDAIRRGD
jgi:hypothetical protein